MNRAYTHIHLMKKLILHDFKSGWMYLREQHLEACTNMEACLGQKAVRFCGRSTCNPRLVNVYSACWYFINALLWMICCDGCMVYDIKMVNIYPGYLRITIFLPQKRSIPAYWPTCANSIKGPPEPWMRDGSFVILSISNGLSPILV